MKEMMNGTAILTDNATAKKMPSGWIVQCRNGMKPWPAVRFGAKPGEMTNIKHVPTKKEAKQLLRECEPPVELSPPSI